MTRHFVMDDESLYDISGEFCLCCCQGVTMTYARARAGWYTVFYNDPLLIHKRVCIFKIPLSITCIQILYSVNIFF